jgi:hypothetical protein
MKFEQVLAPPRMNRLSAANEIIISECEKFEAITLIKKFVPSEDMLFDNVHLNNKKGTAYPFEHCLYSLR